MKDEGLDKWVIPQLLGNTHLSTRALSQLTTMINYKIHFFAFLVEVGIWNFEIFARVLTTTLKANSGTKIL